MRAEDYDWSGYLVDYAGKLLVLEYGRGGVAASDYDAEALALTSVRALADSDTRFAVLRVSGENVVLAARCLLKEGRLPGIRLVVFCDGAASLVGPDGKMDAYLGGVGRFQDDWLARLL